MTTFIIDCPTCKCRVAAERCGSARNNGYNDVAGEPYCEDLLVGKCPACSTLLAGHTYQLAFSGHDAEEDAWSTIVRVFPKPSKAFSSHRIPHSLIASLEQGDRAMQAGAETAACVMFGRALEALCHDILQPSDDEAKTKKRPIMLAQGIAKLKEGNHIDQRLYDWSQELRAFRNVAAHASDEVILRRDAEDLQTFVFAIVEYVYDLADRYQQFKARLERTRKK